MGVCSACGVESAEEFRFCPHCGSSLPAGGGPEERKVVTVLFADLVGFTARATEMDPEDVRSLLNRYHKRLRRELERFGGTVEKFIGDAVMAVFGAPAGHEDDPERAVRAALAIREWAREEECAVRLRIAIATGEALVSLGASPSSGEGIVAGDIVNVASRLQAAAPVNGILVGNATYTATRDSIVYRKSEPVLANGKAEPLAVWEALELRPETLSGFPMRIRVPLLGRDEEFAALAHALARARSHASPQLMTVLGVPGIGKSRLVYELMKSLERERDSVRWRQGRCLPYGDGVAFWALAEIAKSEAGVLESDPPEVAAAKLRDAVPAVVGQRDALWVGRELERLAGGGGAEQSAFVQRDEAFAAWRRYLEALAEERPLVLVFEDLHWADGGLLDFIDELVDRVAGVPLLVVCTARPELLERRPGWGGGKPNAVTLSLTPLDDNATASLITLLLGDSARETAVHGALLARASGNPLYAEQYARVLLERGRLDEPPETVQAIIAARLDVLSPEEKRTLQDGAVVGELFWAGAVASIGDSSTSWTEEALHKLARKQFVERRRSSSVADEVEYAFSHVLIRDVAYTQIPRQPRGEKHRRCAEWIEALGRADDHAELLVHHYRQALELLAAAGAKGASNEIAPRLKASLVLAADRVMTIDIGKAEAYYREALGLTTSDADRGRLLAKLGLVAYRVGNVEEAAGDTAEGIRLLREQGDLAGAGEAMAWLAENLNVRGHGEEARSMLQEAIELLEGQQASAELASAYVVAARDAVLDGRPREAIDWAEKALTVATADRLHPQTCRAFQFRGLGRYVLGDLAGIVDLDEALRLGLAAGLSTETCQAYLNLANALWLQKSPADALAMQRNTVAFGEERGVSLVAMWAKAETAWFLFDLGRWDELLRLADEVIRWERETGGNQPGIMALTYKAYVLLERGEISLARELMEEFERRAREAGDTQVLVPALAVAGLIEAACGHTDAAARLARDLERATRGNPQFRARLLPAVVRMLIASGLDALARDLLDGANHPDIRSENALVAARAVLAEWDGRVAEARELYADAAQRWSAYGFVLEHAHALDGLSRCLARLGYAEEAERLRAEAEALFERLELGAHAVAGLRA